MSPQDVAGKVGETIGTSDWVEMSQERINLFADATGDHQFIHIDAEKAKMTPFGGTIAHGFLTLSLLPMLFSSALRIASSLSINYGLDGVRFPHPVPVGSRIRVRVTLKGVREIAGAIQTVTHLSVEREGQDKPCCVAETLSLYYP